MTKTFNISKHLVFQAYKHVKRNAGSAGVDGQSLLDYESNLKGNLYKFWNRMSSGSYSPAPVKAVEIPKKSGGTRLLGVPTVEDRIAQMTVKLMFEPEVEPHFLDDSYGYRRGKSALDAVGVTRERCWRNDWVLEFDVKGMFDNISHDLLMKAVRKHTKIKWVELYIERWLTASLQLPSGEIKARARGTPQGGVISPVLSNLFMHYVFDKWMDKHHPDVLWCRYADDGLVHCKTKQQAHLLLSELKTRFAECELELHPKKTQIVYCKDGKRKRNYSRTSFDFLGYTFRRRTCKSKQGKLFVGFIPAVSASSKKAMRTETRRRNWRNRTELSLNEIAKRCNPVLRGWQNYYGHYCRSELNAVWRHFNKTLVSWLMSKYKSLKGHKRRAVRFLEKIVEREPNLFVHWKMGML